MNSADNSYKDKFMGVKLSLELMDAGTLLAFILESIDIGEKTQYHEYEAVIAEMKDRLCELEAYEQRFRDI